MNLNTLKGILIILVIVDHNEFSRSLFPRFLDGFGFHVLGFLTIPFLKPANSWNRDFLQYLFRLYHPFLVIVTAMALLIAIKTPVAPLEQGRNWLLALYSGNATILKQTTQMGLLWFLPSFVSLALLRTAIENSGNAVRTAAIALSCAAHLFIGTVAGRIENYLPLGLLPALYVIPLGYLGALLHQRCYARLERRAAFALALATFALVKFAQMRLGLHNEIGFADVADYSAPHALLLNDLEAVCGVLMLFQVSRFDLGRYLETCGRYSMQVYLFHAFVALLVYKALLKLPVAAGPLPLFTVSLAATVLLTVPLGRWMAGHKLAGRLMFPRTTLEFLGFKRGPAADPAVRAGASARGEGSERSGAT